jgi:hypothetical protein
MANPWDSVTRLDELERKVAVQRWTALVSGAAGLMMA